MKEDFTKYLCQHFSKFKVVNKDQSLLMKLFTKLLFFNNFNQFATTIGYTCYLPNSFNDNYDTLTVIAHEYQHAKDYNKLKLLFPIIYLFPQLLFLAVVLFPVIKFWSLIFLLFLIPIPAYGRMKLELRGYVMSLFAYTMIYRYLGIENISERQINLVNAFEKHFTSSSYYFMWPFGVRKYLILSLNKINSDSIFDDATFLEVKNALELTFENNSSIS